MSAFLFYIARSGLYLSVFHAFYLLVMRRTTFFRLNRLALLLGSAVCILLPLLRVRTAALSAAAGPLSITGVGAGTDAASPGSGISWITAAGILYFAGAAVCLVTTLVSAWKMSRLARDGQRLSKDGYRTVIMESDFPSFTFGKTIFIGRKDLAQNPAIFTHEAMHVRCRHYLDLLLFRLIQIGWWWNPLVWIARTELGLVHEYEADEGVINQGIDATQYQLLLVRKAVGEQRFSLASGFQHAQLKNRIAMMLKPSSLGWMRLSYLAMIPVLATLAYACNPTKNSKAPEPAPAAPEAPAQVQEAEVPSIPVETKTPEAAATTEVPFQLVEVKPSFRGGDANMFAKYINEHLSYPESAKEDCIQGRVTLQFAVEPDGSMSSFKVLRGVRPDLDAEALRVLSSCTEKWTPGMQNGVPVRVMFTFPIIFKLQ